LNILPPGRLAPTDEQRWFSQNVRYRRNTLGLTVKQLGEKMGVGASYVSHIESGLTSNVTIDQLYRIAEALHVDPALLLRQDPFAWKHVKRDGTRSIEHIWFSQGQAVN